MKKSQPAPLSIPGMPRKGDAAPAMTSLENPPSAGQATAASSPPTADSPADVPGSGSQLRVRLSSRVQATIAVTVRLDEPRYERMKSWGATNRVTNQEIIVAALDRLFVSSDEELLQAIATVRK